MGAKHRCFWKRQHAPQVLGGVGGCLPRHLVTAGHGEQPLPLQHPVPRLDAGIRADWDRPLTRLYFRPQLSSGFTIRMSVCWF